MRPITKISFIVGILLIIGNLFTQTSEASVSEAANFKYDQKDVSVEVYSRDVGEEKNSPIFKYGDLINRAIEYKVSNPTENVKIKFAIYKIGEKAYIGFNPTHDSYGYVKGYDYDGENSEKLIYSIVKAAQNEIDIEFVYHKNNTGNVLNYLNSFMDKSTNSNTGKKVKDFLQVKKIAWGSEAFQQMHSKFMTVSHYLGDDGEVIRNTTFTTTGNVDDHGNDGLPTQKDWVQSGLLINNHYELMSSYNNYFALIFNNANSHQGFIDAVRGAHQQNLLNFDDQHFSAFFMPIPLYPEGNYTYIPETGDGSNENGNAWDINFNPIAKYIEKMSNTDGNQFLKANVYHLKMDNLGQKLYDEVDKIVNSTSPGIKEFSWLVNTNSYEHLLPLETFNNLGIIKYPISTHTKDILIGLNDVSEYYTITGSTNLKLDEHVSKANNSTVVKEYTNEHPIFNAYQEIYNYQD